jgi:hypothetical protein
VSAAFVVDDFLFDLVDEARRTAPSVDNRLLAVGYDNMVLDEELEEKLRVALNRRHENRQ